MIHVRWNLFINIQKNKKEQNENKGVIIIFGNKASKIRNGKYKDEIKDLELTDINNGDVGGGTNLENAFLEAQKYLYIDDKFTSRKLLFLTDGNDDSNIKNLCKEIKDCGFKIYFIGLGNTYNFYNLTKFPHNYCIITENFEEIKQYIKKI